MFARVKLLSLTRINISEPDYLLKNQLYNLTVHDTVRRWAGWLTNLMDLMRLGAEHGSDSEPRSVLGASDVLQPLLWLSNLMSLASSHTLFMQENKEENAAPPKSVNCN